MKYEKNAYSTVICSNGYVCDVMSKYPGSKVDPVCPQTLSREMKILM